MFQPATVIRNAAFFNTAAPAAVAAGFSAAVVPAEIAVAGSTQTTASGDARRINLATAVVECIVITPWNSGDFSGTKYSQSWYLNPQSARDILLGSLSTVSWQSALLVLVMADSEALLLTELQALHMALPLDEITQAMRRATATQNHESEKRFIPGQKAKAPIPINSAALSCCLFQESVAANMAVSEAAASDTAPTALLSDFLSRRSARVQASNTEVQQQAAAGGVVKYLASVSGDISEQLKAATLPNEQAPFACLIAVGGETAALNKIKEALTL